MNKRFIVIVSITGVILLAMVGVLYYASQKQQTVTNQNDVVDLQIKKVLDEPVIAPIASFDQNTIWYFNNEGKLFSIRADGTGLSEYPLPPIPGSHLTTALWPKKSNDFIAISTGDGFSKNYYNSASKIFIALSKNMQYLDWMPDGKRIVYVDKADNGKSQQLMISDADGAGSKSISNLFWPDLVLKAGNDGKTVLMYRSSIIGDANKIYASNIETGEITTLIEGKNTAAAWLPSANKFLFESEGKIYLYDVGAKKTVDLNLKTTLSQTTATDAVVYANTDGEFVRVELNTNKKENYFTPDTKVQVKSMIMVGNTVYYVDSADQKLYAIMK